MVQVSRDSGVISPSDNGAEDETEDEGEEGGAQEELRVHDTPTLTRCSKTLRIYIIQPARPLRPSL